MAILDDWFYTELEHIRHKWQKFVTSCYIIGGRVVTVPEERDDITGASVVIPVVHHEVHEGETFQASYYNGAVANAGTIEILLVTAAAHTAHLTFDVAAGGDAHVELLQNVTVNVAGTAITERNLNRTASDGDVTVTATHTPTVVGGQVLSTFLAPGGTGPRAAGGTGRPSTEWLLAKSKNYLIRGTNVSGNNQPMSIVVQWYEEE